MSGLGVTPELSHESSEEENCGLPPGSLIDAVHIKNLGHDVGNIANSQSLQVAIVKKAKQRRKQFSASKTMGTKVANNIEVGKLNGLVSNPHDSCYTPSFY